MFVRQHSFDSLLVLGAVLLCFWTAFFSPFSPFSVETAMRHAFDDFAFPDTTNAVSAFDGQTSVTVDWNRTPATILAHGVYPAVVTLKGAVPDRQLTEAEFQDHGTLQGLLTSHHLRNVTVSFPVSVHRNGLGWAIQGMGTPQELLSQRIEALLTRSHGGSMRFVKDSGVYGSGDLAAREQNYSVAVVFAVVVFIAAVTALITDALSMGRTHRVEIWFFLLQCAALLSVCAYQLTYGALSLLAVDFF